MRGSPWRDSPGLEPLPPPPAGTLTLAPPTAPLHSQGLSTHSRTAESRSAPARRREGGSAEGVLQTLFALAWLNAHTLDSA